MNKGYVFLGFSIILFILGAYSYFSVFWMGLICLFISCILFFFYASEFIVGDKMLRFQCRECKEYLIGGAEDVDTKCPLCGGNLIFKESVNHD